MAKKRRIEKRSYCSPEITKVNLRSEEAVLSSCKTDFTGGSILNDAGNCKYHGSYCDTTGS